MSRRWLFGLRELTLDLGPRLGSWRLSIVLMIVAALYNAFLAIWAGSSPPHVVRNIAGLLPFWLIYGLLLVNTAVCLWRRLPTLRRQIGLQPIFGSHEPRWSVTTDTATNHDQVRD